MKTSIGAAVIAGTLALAALIAIDPAAAASSKSGVSATADATSTDPGTRRHHRHYRRYAYRPYPTYYGRPVTYAPAPFFPIPPLWGYGWEWW